jgi:hypothetical protein
MSLDVSYRGEAVETVELYLDNALVAQRRINTTQARGIISFGLETVLLTAGTHDVTVKAYGVDGKASVVAGKLRIPAADLSAPVRIAYPQNGTQVSGIVPIRVTLDSDLQKLKPYVTFFVDKELKVLRNYPPYEYVWDTTRVTNGWHLVEAWTQTEESVGPTKARPVHVNVNNSGGETKKQNGIRDLRGEVKNPGITLPIPKAGPNAPAVSESVNPPAGGVAPFAANTGGRTVEPNVHGLGLTAAPTLDPSIHIGGAASGQEVGPKMAGNAATRPKDHLLIATVKGMRPGTEGTLPPIAGTGSAHNGDNPTTTSVRRGETLASVSQRTGLSPGEIARLNNLPQNTTHLPKGAHLIVPRGGSFDVAFNGIPIVFDVLPRIEGGIKLAPFRQIFEHTGGRLYWFGGAAQTVRAVNDTREIEIKIGNADATVNNHTIRMERTPYIDSGRTIVPLTFIRDSLSVKIDFNEKTGHLLIESNK